MNLPLYCILNGERAVKAVRTDEGGIAVFQYYPENDDFRGNIRLLDRLLSDDLDVKYVTEEEFIEFVERQGSKYRADPQLRRKPKIATMQRARKFVVLAVKQVDPERARVLRDEFPEGIESPDAEQEKNLKYEEALTRKLLEAVADLNVELVKMCLGAAKKITGLFDPPLGKSPGKTTYGTFRNYLGGSESPGLTGIAWHKLAQYLAGGKEVGSNTPPEIVDSNQQGARDTDAMRRCFGESNRWSS